MAVSMKTLARHWIHSHEEDSEAGQVFRPAGFAFPLSRGRLELALAADGKATLTFPGASDRPENTRGRWSLEGDQLHIETPKGAPRERSYRVVSADAKRLVLARA